MIHCELYSTMGVGRERVSITPKHHPSCEDSEQKSSNNRGYEVHLPRSCSANNKLQLVWRQTWLFVSKSRPLITFTSARGSSAPASSVQIRFVAFTKRVRCTVAPRSESSYTARSQSTHFTRTSRRREMLTYQGAKAACKCAPQQQWEQDVLPLDSARGALHDQRSGDRPPHEQPTPDRCKGAGRRQPAVRPGRHGFERRDQDGW